MALVSYSDSEESDDEAPVAPVAPAGPGAFQKKSEPRKIQVALPTIQPEPQNGDTEPPTKRARTAGGFNSFLPAPKRPAAAQQGLKKGVNLTTSSEAAFSRAAPIPTTTGDNTENDETGYDEFGNPRAKDAPRPIVTETADKPAQSEETKIVGKATRFKPLSVANNRKKVVKKAAKPVAIAEGALEATTGNRDPEPKLNEAEMPAKVKPKRSLFSVPQPEEEAPEVAPEVEKQLDILESVQPDQTAPPAPANSLEAVAADLNLTPAQRRQLFGRNGGKNAPANIAHFNMDSEYAANEQIRQAGEAAEHRAVKSIAPGKHSLQQLVNNARSNQDSIEDKWAEGRRNQGGSNYGWSK
ncbi:hypothetical protein LTR85_005151 [Meristemomyces frigidus]|nr:hypothetical protein LTR85_005151 [Meristemomyces frigidus]